MIDNNSWCCYEKFYNTFFLKTTCSETFSKPVTKKVLGSLLKENSTKWLIHIFIPEKSKISNSAVTTRQ